MGIFVARQPIFDAGDKLRGYELLYRGDAAVSSADGSDRNTMSAKVIANSLLGMGLRDLAGDVPGFVNITKEQLMAHTYELFTPASVVIELLETCTHNDETRAAARAMQAAGYTIALDDFEIGQSNAELLDMASIVKIDVLNRSRESLEAVVEHVRPFNVRMLAERVETQEQYAQCRDMGFELFQGYFHARPETIHTEDVDAQQASMIRLLNLLRDPRSSDAAIEEAFASDPGLCYKLIRMVHSAAIGAPAVNSIGHAARLVGRNMMHRWLYVLFTASFASEGDTARELVRHALARGRFCELIAWNGAGGFPADVLFMTGLLSRLDALMRVTMARVVSGIEVTPDTRSALLSRSGSQAPVLCLAEAYETGAWDRVTEYASIVGLDPDIVGGIYVESIQWAEQQLLLA